jgi:DNA-binding transcriptional regulator of glucitol operon
MLAEYKKKTNIGIALAIAIWILGGILVGLLSKMPEENLRSIQGLGLIPFIYGCCCYAKGKGYHGAWGLLGIFFIFGLIALVCFPDKNKATKKIPMKPDASKQVES